MMMIVMSSHWRFAEGGAVEAKVLLVVVPRGRPTLLLLCSHPARIEGAAPASTLSLTSLIMLGGVILEQRATVLSANYFATVWCAQPSTRDWISPIFSMARGSYRGIAMDSFVVRVALFTRSITPRQETPSYLLRQFKPDRRSRWSFRRSICHCSTEDAEPCARHYQRQLCAPKVFITQAPISDSRSGCKQQ